MLESGRGDGVSLIVGSQRVDSGECLSCHDYTLTDYNEYILSRLPFALLLVIASRSFLYCIVIRLAVARADGQVTRWQGQEKEENRRWQATFVQNALKSNAAGIHVQLTKNIERKEKKGVVAVDRKR